MISAVMVVEISGFASYPAMNDFGGKVVRA